MMTFASNFAPLWDVAIWWLLLLSALASVFPSMRGHGSGPLFAAPAILCIWLLDSSIAAGYGMGDPTSGQRLAFFAPSIIGLLSIAVWIWTFWHRRRHTRAEK